MLGGLRGHRWVLAGLGLMWSWLALACSRPLPDPESPGAQLYAQKCGLCHRAYAPNALKAAMWQVQIERMQEMMARRGVPPLSSDEKAKILAYLEAHAG